MGKSQEKADSVAKNKENERLEIDKELFIVPIELTDDYYEFSEIDDGTIIKTSNSSFSISVKKAEQSTTQEFKNSMSEKLHTVLDIAGFVPAFGAVPDVINGIFYLCQGDRANMALSFAAAVPIYGDAVAAVAKGAKYTARFSKVGKLQKVSKAVVTRCESDRIKKAAMYYAEFAANEKVKKIGVLWTKGTKFNAKAFVRDMKKINPAIEITSLETHMMGVQMEKMVNRVLVKESKMEMSEAVKLIKEEKLFGKVVSKKPSLRTHIEDFQKVISEIYAGGWNAIKDMEEMTRCKSWKLLGGKGSDPLIEYIRKTELYKPNEIGLGPEKRLVNSIREFLEKNPNGIKDRFTIRFMQTGKGFGNVSKAEAKLTGHVNRAIKQDLPEILTRIRKPNGATTLIKGNVTK